MEKEFTTVITLQGFPIWAFCSTNEEELRRFTAQFAADRDLKWRFVEKVPKNLNSIMIDPPELAEDQIKNIIETSLETRGWS